MCHSEENKSSKKTGGANMLMETACSMKLRMTILAWRWVKKLVPKGNYTWEADQVPAIAFGNDHSLQIYKGILGILRE